MTTGEWIKTFREEKGLTQSQLGDLCGMADSAIRRYENGRANPKIETLQKIADALEINVLKLIGIKTDQQKANRSHESMNGFESFIREKLVFLDMVRNMGFSTDQSIQIMIWMNLEDLRDMTGSYGSGRITEYLSDIANLIRQ